MKNALIAANFRVVHPEVILASRGAHDKTVSLVGVTPAIWAAKPVFPRYKRCRFNGFKFC
jgi:hypothetical protein